MQQHNVYGDPMTNYVNQEYYGDENQMDEGQYLPASSEHEYIARAPCQVCGYHKSGAHYGARSCRPCAHFFYNYIKLGSAPKCKRDNSCGITVRTRKNCRACRFEACLKAGMEPGWVRRDEVVENEDDMSREIVDHVEEPLVGSDDENQEYYENEEMLEEQYLPDPTEPPEVEYIASLEPKCQICGDYESGEHYGGRSCVPCAKFFRMYIVYGNEPLCIGAGSCVITVDSRNECRKCRFEACLLAGMEPKLVYHKKSNQPCQICGDHKAAYRYGGQSCNACSSFFKKYVNRLYVYECTQDNSCEITIETRNDCKACRFKACLKAGMEPERETSSLKMRKRQQKDDPDGTSYEKVQRMSDRVKSGELIEDEDDIDSEVVDIFEEPSPILASEPGPAEQSEQVAPTNPCQVCHGAEIFRNGPSCRACLSFFETSKTRSHTFKCDGTNSCVITVKTRKDCRRCRFDACLMVGMRQYVAPLVSVPPTPCQVEDHHTYTDIIDLVASGGGKPQNSPCQVCENPKSGSHYGGQCCQACAQFFYSIFSRKQKTMKMCNNACVINFKIAKKCRGCRFEACLRAGMEPEQIRRNQAENWEQYEDDIDTDIVNIFEEYIVPEVGSIEEADQRGIEYLSRIPMLPIVEQSRIDIWKEVIIEHIFCLRTAFIKVDDADIFEGDVDFQPMIEQWRIGQNYEMEWKVVAMLCATFVAKLFCKILGTNVEARMVYEEFSLKLEKYFQLDSMAQQDYKALVGKIEKIVDDC